MMCICFFRFVCQLWTINLHQNAHLNSTHDLGFMIHSWAKLAWELERDTRAYDTIIRAAKSLASRYSRAVGAIRSWDTCVTKRYSFQDPSEDFLVIIVSESSFTLRPSRLSLVFHSSLILSSVFLLLCGTWCSSPTEQDNMMNLDMIFWAAAELKSDELYQIAATHARTTQASHIRKDYSTTHLVVFDPKTASPSVKSRLTNQGYADNSTWARGQAWAIAGFAQTYHWTRDDSFLETAQQCADYFLNHLPANRIPPWDFLAPNDASSPEQPPDTSAALIAVYGMLLIHEAHMQNGTEDSKYFAAALDILSAVCSLHMSPATRFTTQTTEVATIVEGDASLGATSDRVMDLVQVITEVRQGQSVAETIVGGATINNYEFAPRRWANHGLVYADYYFLLVGNKLLELDVVSSLMDIKVTQKSE